MGFPFIGPTAKKLEGVPTPQSHKSRLEVD
jgi:hypothetical protein